jgi:hypothetical protein
VQGCGFEPQHRKKNKTKHMVSSKKRGNNYIVHLKMVKIAGCG